MYYHESDGKIERKEMWVDVHGKTLFTTTDVNGLEIDLFFTFFASIHFLIIIKSERSEKHG